MTNQDLSLTDDCGKSADLWSDFFRLHIDSAALIPELRALLRSCPAKLGPYLADVKADSPSGGFTKDDIRAVEKHIYNHYKHRKAIVPLQILRQVVLQLNQRLQKCIPSPTLLDRMRADPNLITKEFPLAQSSVDMWLAAEREWLAQCCRRDAKPSREPIAWEMAIAFAAFHGGVLSVGFAVALAEALANPRCYFACSEYRAYGDLQIQAKAGYPLTRWYPDDRLLLLMSRIEPGDVLKAIERSCPPKATQTVRSRCIAKTIMDGINRELRRYEVAPAF